MLGFDLETTGVDTENDRTVTAALVYIEPGRPPVTINRLVNPGVDIPDGAAAIHGITTEKAFAEGEPPHTVLLDVVGCLADALPADPLGTIHLRGVGQLDSITIPQPTWIAVPGTQLEVRTDSAAEFATILVRPWKAMA